MPYQVKQYNVKMSVQVGSFPGCCGGSTLFGFQAEGDFSKITEEQKKKMYDQLWIELAGQDRLSGTLVAMDALLDFGDWETGRSGGTEASSWVAGPGLGCGEVSLEDFCRHHKFNFVGQAVNRNSGNVVGAMVKAVREADESDPSAAPKIYTVDKPDFSDDDTKPASPETDTAAVIASLQQAIERARSNA